MREEEVLACAFKAWYDRFRHVTFKSEIIPLPEDFVRFLSTDGIRFRTDGNDDGQSSDGSWGSGGGDSDSDDVPEGHFPELEKKIRDTIKRLHGGVLPKLNWSAPKDAHWMQPSLKCTSAEEVFTLLKASEFVTHDLCHGFDHCSTARTRPDEFTLVLRRWHDLHESNEFRCFVRNANLIAASQRQTSGFYEHLTEQGEVEALQQAIQTFFQEHIRQAFPLDRYVFDVYVDIPPRRRVWLVDFSPWGPTTDPCLFDWEELNGFPVAADSTDVPETATEPSTHFQLRVVREVTERRLGRPEDFHRVPLELAELGAGKHLDEFLKTADRVLEQKRAQESRNES